MYTCIYVMCMYMCTWRGTEEGMEGVAVAPGRSAARRQDVALALGVVDVRCVRVVSARVVSERECVSEKECVRVSVRESVYVRECV